MPSPPRSDADAARSTVVGFYAAAAVIGAVGVAVEVGTATAGDPVAVPLTAAMACGAAASVGAIVRRRYVA